MGFADLHGRARVNPRAPSAWGVCDSCGEWRNLSDLAFEMQWHGPVLKRTGFRVCHDKCLDVPQDQLRPIILPTPDPKPVRDPRVEQHSSFPDFTLLLRDDGIPIYDDYGNPIVVGGTGVAPQPGPVGSLIIQVGAGSVTVSGTIVGVNAPPFVPPPPVIPSLDFTKPEDTTYYFAVI